jgi:hypothetical protein
MRQTGGFSETTSPFLHQLGYNQLPSLAETRPPHWTKSSDKKPIQVRRISRECLAVSTECAAGKVASSRASVMRELGGSIVAMHEPVQERINT